ncbi:unnamed protein product [Brassica rapa]|uniref:Uncharacterized protein n=2 Tax=Brassica campestris TaxID=3711 RepID=A0A8D9HDB5_BRACM|nr:unnamed protein product [Brassica rapa]
MMSYTCSCAFSSSDVMQAGCKFLVFAHHHSMLEALHQFLKKKKVVCIRIDGSIPASSSQALVSDF